jgi:hypothetical protein
MEKVGAFYGHLEYITSFGILFGHLVIKWEFGIYSPVFVLYLEKSGNPDWDNFFILKKCLIIAELSHG